MRGLHYKAMDHMNLRLTTLAATVLSSWDEFERAACRLQQLDSSEDIGDMLLELDHVFTVAGESFGSDKVKLANAAWLRLRGDAAERLNDSVRNVREHIYRRRAPRREDPELLEASLPAELHSIIVTTSGRDR
jgi:hypothetical protein